MYISMVCPRPINIPVHVPVHVNEHDKEHIFVHGHGHRDGQGQGYGKGHGHGQGWGHLPFQFKKRMHIWIILGGVSDPSKQNSAGHQTPLI